MSEKEKIDSLQREKELRLCEYMALQDRADVLNAEIYKACCGIETLNGQIKQAKKAEENRSRRKKASLPVNGKHRPS